MAKLTTFLKRLTTNAATARRFHKDPHGVMKAAGLSPEQQKLIRGRRMAKLARAIEEENPGAKKPIVCVILSNPSTAQEGFWDMSDEKPRSTKAKRSKSGSKTSRKRRPAKSKGK
jgi:hypothetical protein